MTGLISLEEAEYRHRNVAEGFNSQQSARTPPQPLVRETIPAMPFPLEALGPTLEKAARAIHERVQAPQAICAQSVLGAATLVAQTRADVMLPTGQTRPLSCYFVTVAASGERKSSADNEALWAIRKHEANLREQYDFQHEEWTIEQDTWEAERRKILADKNARSQKNQKLKELGPTPKPPLSPYLLFDEPTAEGLTKLLIYNYPSVGVFAAEGAAFVGGHGMTEEKKLFTAAVLSNFWDGQVIKRIRAGDQAQALIGRRLSIHLMMQEEVAMRFLGDPVLADQGLLSRFLVTAPNSSAGQRLWKDPDPHSESAVKSFGARLLNILEAPLSSSDKVKNELTIRSLVLSVEAKAEWIKFSDEVERSVAPGGDLESIRALANKLAEHAARLAGVLTIIEDMNAVEISYATMGQGIKLVLHYAQEAVRMVQAAKIHVDLTQAQAVLNWAIKNCGEGVVSLPDIYQRGPNRIRDKRTAARLVAILEDHGWFERIDAGASVNGTYRKDAWRIEQV